MSGSKHEELLRLALEEAKKCVPTPTAFCVGCVLASTWPESADSSVVLATGFSRELPGNTHAEANALTKLKALTPEQLVSLLPGAFSLSQLPIDAYTTMEPCSVRTSGLAPCSDALIAAKIRRCFIGVSEPDDFVHCEGAQKLHQAGIEVIWLKGLEDECLQVARRGHS